MRKLDCEDEQQLRTFWSEEVHGHLYSICYLDHFGWDNSQLSYYGWFYEGSLVAYFMHYTSTAQWGFSNITVIPKISALLTTFQIRYITGLEKYVVPVLALLPANHSIYQENCIVAVLDHEQFTVDTLPTRAFNARLSDIEAIANVQMSVKERFTPLDFKSYCQFIWNLLVEKWRRIAVATTEDGQIGTVAQTVAEGNQIAIVGSIATRPELRKKGLATLVTAYLCAQLVHEKKRVYLEYSRDNAPAASIYQKIGFTAIGDTVFVEVTSVTP